MILSSISKKLRAYRKNNNLTIAQMAEQSQLSTALISQLERDLANPTLSVLQILANTLGISITELLAEDTEEESLVLRASDREKSFYNDSDLKSYHYILTPEEMKSNLRLALVHIEPKSETLSGEFFVHKNDEIVFILSGDVTTIYENSEIVLHEGDTLRIPGNKKHRYYNKSKKSVEMLTIKTSRNF